MRPIIRGTAPDHIIAASPHQKNAPVRSVAYPSLKEFVNDAIEARVISNNDGASILKGNESLVAKADKLMARFERFDLLAPRKSWEDDVAGVIPNIPAFLAGHPMSMRRKVDHRAASAPLAIVMELTGSAGLTETFEARGAAYLALARLLTTRRPVELYVSSTFGVTHSSGMGCVFVRVETDPLHLAVSAQLLMSQEFLHPITSFNLRRLETQGCWAFGGSTYERFKPEITYRPMLEHVSDLVVFPASYLFDEAARDPETWVELQLKRLSGESDDE